MRSDTLWGKPIKGRVDFWKKKIPTQVLQCRFVFTQDNKCCDVDFESEFDKLFF